MGDIVEKRTTVITVSRQMGSGGDYIGYEVAKALGFTYVNREILYRAAGILKRSVTSLEQDEEKSPGFFRKILRTFALGVPDTPYTPPMAPPVYDRELFDLESKIIMDIVAQHDAVIIGRAGFHILKDRLNTIHMFFHAPYAYRVKRVMRAHNIVDVQEAQAKVEESDRRREKFIKEMTETEWTNTLNYHLCIDSSSAPLPDMVKVVVGFIEKSLLHR